MGKVETTFEEEANKIAVGLEKAYEKLIDFKKQKNTPLVVDRDGQVVEISPYKTSSDSVWFSSKAALKIVNGVLREGNDKVRIATGFFSAKGWNLLRESVGDKQVDLLVGVNEGSRNREDVKDARMVVIQEIKMDLGIGYTENRRQAVADLIKRLESNKLRFVDARATRHHAKLYMSDNSVIAITSANTSIQGLEKQVEAGIVVTENDEITYLTEAFDEHFRQARNLSRELLASLKSWLEQAKPWDVYLRTLAVLEELNLEEDYAPPADYQRSMIAESLRNIREFQGNMLVATTGLGKTIMAVHIALQLQKSEAIKSVLVIGPKAVKDSWERELLAAGVSQKYIVYQSLDRKEQSSDRGLKAFQDIQLLISRRWLVIVDECHELRNCTGLTKDEPQRQAFARLLPLIHLSRCKVLLLTGSPYAKSASSLYTQLRLLPHYRSKRSLTKRHLKDTESFVSLPVVTQLTAPHVVKYYGQPEGDDIYINRGGKRWYLPKTVELHSIKFSLILKQEVIKAVKQGCFIFKIEERDQKSIEHWVMISWMSSPEALKDILQKVIRTSGDLDEFVSPGVAYKVNFEMSIEERRKQLLPIVEKLNNIPLQADSKLMTLLPVLQKAYEQKQKVILFSERRPTVAYLAKAIETLFSDLRVFSTINYNNKDGDYQSKDYDKEVVEAIKAFAPVANNCVGEYDYSYDLFITTDAYGIGVNLQDASVVINYDLAWTAIEPIQRLGRILRFWHEPRSVNVYSFDQDDDKIEKLVRRRNNLNDRHNESKKIMDLPVLHIEEGAISVSPSAMAPTVRSGKLDMNYLAETEVVSPYYQHAAQLYQNSNHVKTIPEDIISSKHYLGKSELVYMQFQYQNEYFRTIYDVRNNQLREASTIQILNWLACDKTTEQAYVPPEVIEWVSDKSLKLWIKKHKVDPELVSRDCTIYLVPKQKEESIDNLAKFR